jgi:serine/threonine-protein kinase
VPPGSSDAPVVKRIRNYDVTRRLAMGGMAEVFLAEQTGPSGFRRQVVLKRILPNISNDPQFVKMFLNEARIAAGLAHPNIVHIYDFFQDETGYCIVMEYVHGENVAGMLRAAHRRSASVGLGHTVRIMTSICEALHYAWDEPDSHGRPRRIVHRDVSPHNAMIGFDGHVKLLDFGIAKALQSEALTSVATLKGKYSYMSPEQVRSEPLDHRADLWSVGVMLWELTTGKRLFKRDTEMSTLHAIMNDPIPRPTSIYPDYPAGLEEIVMGILERDRDRRTADARTVSDALSNVAQESGWNTTANQLAALMRTLLAERLAQEDPTANEATNNSAAAPTRQVGSQSVVPRDQTPMSRVDAKRDPTLTWVIVAVLAASLMFWVLIYPLI